MHDCIYWHVHFDTNLLKYQYTQTHRHTHIHTFNDMQTCIQNFFLHPMSFSRHDALKGPLVAHSLSDHYDIHITYQCHKILPVYVYPIRLNYFFVALKIYRSMNFSISLYIFYLMDMSSISSCRNFVRYQ